MLLEALFFRLDLTVIDLLLLLLFVICLDCSLGDSVMSAWLRERL
jgi:hypothetical protein